MNIKNALNINLSNQNLVLLGALGLIAYQTFPQMNIAAEQDAQIFELDENGEAVAVPAETNAKKSYIQKAKTLLTMNDYGVIKTLYKIQSVMDDITTLSSPALAAVSTQQEQADLFDVFTGIEPFLSDSKRTTIAKVVDNIDRTKSTVRKISDVKQRIHDVPEDAPKGERLRILINEIPNLSGIPMLENLNNLRNLTSMLKPLTESVSSAAESAPEEPHTQEDDYNDIYELVDLLESKNKKKRQG